MPTMICDLFCELSLPPFAPHSEIELYHNTLAQWEHAETLGFSTAWLVEHHFMPEYSHSSAPDVFLAAASQRTKTLRLGHAIMPLPYHHPIRAAEQLATLDVISNGRVEFGFGRGFSPKEYATFGAHMADSRTQTHETLQVIQQGLRDGRVSFQGKHFQYEDLPVLPRAVQQPHPPLWMASVSPDSFELAAEINAGALVGPFKPWFMVKEDIRHYRAAQKKNHTQGDVAMTVGIYCLPDGKQAKDEAKQAFEWFYGRLLGQTKPILEKLYDGFEYYRRYGAFTDLMDKAVNLTLLDTLGMAIVGDADHCVKKLNALHKEGVDRVLLAFGAGAMSHKQALNSMDYFAEAVMPRLNS